MTTSPFVRATAGGSLVSVAAVPAQTGNASAVSEAATSLATAATSVTTVSDGVTHAWNGLTAENYSAPESPMVKATIPTIATPMSTISTNLSTAASALQDAATDLSGWSTRRTTLISDIGAFQTRAAAANSAAATAKAAEPADAESSSTGTWKDDPAIVSENNGLWARVFQLEDDLTTICNELVLSMTGPVGIATPVFAGTTVPEFVAGVAVMPTARSSADVSVLSAEAFSYSATVTENGITKHGSGFEANAMLIEAQATVTWDKSTWGVGEASASFDAGASTSGTALFSYGADGVHTKAEVEAEALVKAQASASHTIGPASGSVSVEASGGAEASAQAALDIGPTGASAEIGGEAFIGAKAEANLTAEVAGLETSAGANVRAGYGVEGHARGSFSAKEIGFDLGAGLSYGVGAGVSVGLSFSPEETWNDIQSWDWTPW